MNREELKQKILEHSNSMFPLIDFFNDIGRNKDPRYDKERAYEDIEKIYDVFIFYKEKCEKLEEENENLLDNKLELIVKNKQQDMLITKLIQVNDKLKQALDILKDNYLIEFLGFNKYGAKPYEIMVNGYIQGFDKEQYELLKEVLGNEKRM